jgi:hypothetical protein
VTGLAENILGGYRAEPQVVAHPSCRGRGDDRCLWTLVDPLPGEHPSPTSAGSAAPNGGVTGVPEGDDSASHSGSLPDPDPPARSVPAAASARAPIQETLPGIPPANS